MKTTSPAIAAGLVITSTVGGLSDRALLRATSTLVRHERHLQGAIIDHLAEIEVRSVYLRRGCSSLFDYAVRELGYSDAAAGRRNRRRAAVRGPAGRARAAARRLADAERRRGVAVGLRPAAAADVAPVDDPVASEPAPPLVLDAAGRQKPVEEASGKSARQVRRMLADLDPELAPPADRVRPLGEGRYELKAVIDADCQQGLEQLRGSIRTGRRTACGIRTDRTAATCRTCTWGETCGSGGVLHHTRVRVRPRSGRCSRVAG